MSVSVVTVTEETAFNILNGRRRKGTESLVNLFGKVLCVSEVVKLKESHLFMVKFVHNVDLIIKRQECLKWQKELAPYTEYILTNLRPTSLQKGSRSAHRVFTVTRGSQLLVPDSVNMILMAESDIVEQYGLQHVNDTTPVDRHDPISDGLFSYQGKVTGVLDVGLGVFELDNTVRLFVGTVPAVHRYSMLRKGATILVQNAHYSTSKQYPKVSIYCCMLTSVKCVDEEDENIQQTGVVKLNQEMKKLLYLQGQSQNQLDHIFVLRKVLKKQFSNILGDRFSDTIFTKLVTSEWLNDNVIHNNEKGPQRMLIDEFLNVPHNCPLVRDDMVSRMFTTIFDLKSNIPEVTNDNMEWKFSRQVSQQVVVGILSVSESTGQTVLYDDTGYIDVVTCCYHGNKDRDESCCHTCTRSCDCSDIDVGDKFLCPYVHTCCVGKVVAVTLYEMICETMVTSNEENYRFLNGPGHSRSNLCDKYLLIDMRNVVYIGNSSEVGISKHEQHISNRVNKLSTNADKNSKFTCDSEQENRSSSANSHLKCKSVGSDLVRSGNDQNDKVITSAKCDIKLEQSKSAEEPNKSSLHKHVKEDGSIMFCRKLECCDEATVILNYNKLKPDANLSNSKGEITSDIEACDENNQNFSFNSENKTDKSNYLPFKLGKSAFKVKPVSNRKRSFLGNHSRMENDTGQNKVPRIDDGKDSVKDNITDRDETSKMVELKCVTGTKKDNCHDRHDSDSDQVTVFIENKGSLMCVDGLRRFNVECAIVDGQENEKVILEFTGKAVKWYPVLYVGTVYQLSTDREPVLSVGLSHDKVKKMLLKNKSRRCLSVSEYVNVTRQWNRSPKSDTLSSPSLVTLQDILKPEFTDKFVSFEGYIINRALVKPGFGPKSFAKDISNGSIYSRLHVQDSSGSEDIWVFLNDRNIVCDKGLTPGNMVRFYGLERKMSQQNNIYTRLVPLSCVQILCARSSERDEAKQVVDRGIDLDKLPVLSLADLWISSNTGLVFQCICDIEKILKVSLKCVCEICGSLVVHTECSNTACHGDGAHKFLARASAIVDDSTSVAMVTLTGSSVQSMLQLSHDQWKCLEEEVTKTGEVFVQQYNPSLTTCLERFVYRLCDNHAVKQTWLLTMRSRSSLDINKIGHDEFCMKTFDTGSSRISTQCLPFLHLECITMHVFEPSTWAIHHLSAKS